jgi:glutamate/tyrosine decarboxylase-like PLP-dependent enzyme
MESTDALNDAVLKRGVALAAEFLAGLGTRPVAPAFGPEAVRAGIDVPLPGRPTDPVAVLEDVVRAVQPGLVASAGPRYFGFVTGGREPVALAADWLASTWDQLASAWVGAPAMCEVEATAGRWVVDLLDLPKESSVGFTTGATQSNLVALAAAHLELLRRRGWDAERDGLRRAPEVPVVVGAQRHSTIDSVLRLLGIGRSELIEIPTDDQGRMRPAAARSVLAGLDEPLVIAQAGQVATGACDPLPVIAEALDGRGWLHVDGAFGLWARMIPDRRHLVAAAERADSWAVDAHKWLNVPYDCAMVVVRDSAAHLRATRKSGAYAMSGQGSHDPEHYVLEFSRRARAFPLYVLIRTLGRLGIRARLQRSCEQAERFAAAAARLPGVRVLNDVVLNQVLLSLDPDDVVAEQVLRRFQDGGTAWAGSTVWDGRFAMRFSVSNWSTTDADIARTVTALRQARAATRP